MRPLFFLLFRHIALVPSVSENANKRKWESQEVKNACIEPFGCVVSKIRSYFATDRTLRHHFRSVYHCHYGDAQYYCYEIFDFHTLQNIIVSEAKIVHLCIKKKLKCEERQFKINRIST